MTTRLLSLGAVTNGFELQRLDVFCRSSSHETPVPWEDRAQWFQQVLIANEATYMEDLMAENALPENDYPTLKEPVEAENEPIQIEREGRNETVTRAWRDEENSRTEVEKRLIKGSIGGKVERRLKSKVFLSLGKHGKRHSYQKHPRQKVVDINFT